MIEAEFQQYAANLLVERLAEEDGVSISVADLLDNLAVLGLMLAGDAKGVVTAAYHQEMAAVRS